MKNSKSEEGKYSLYRWNCDIYSVVRVKLDRNRENSAKIGV